MITRCLIIKSYLWSFIYNKKRKKKKQKSRMVIIKHFFRFRKIIRNVTDLFIDLQHEIFQQNSIYRKSMFMQIESFNGDENFKVLCPLLNTKFLKTCVFYKNWFLFKMPSHIFSIFNIFDNFQTLFIFIRVWYIRVL